MKLIQNADGTISTRGGFDEEEITPHYVTQYNVAVDEMSPEEIAANRVIELGERRKAAAKVAVAAKAQAQTAQAQQVEARRSWWRSYLADVRRAALENSMFGSLAHEESGFDVAEAAVTPVNALSGNMATSWARADQMGAAFYLPQGKEDFGMKVITPAAYKTETVNTKDEFGYTSINANQLDAVSLANARKKGAKVNAKDAIRRSLKTRKRVKTTLRGMGAEDDMDVVTLGTLGAPRAVALGEQLAKLTAALAKANRADKKLMARLSKEIAQVKAALAREGKKQVENAKKATNSKTAKRAANVARAAVRFGNFMDNPAKGTAGEAKLRAKQSLKAAKKAPKAVKKAAKAAPKKVAKAAASAVQSVGRRFRKLW